MNQHRATIEIIAPTINEAIEKGLNELGLSREAVEIEILDEGSRGLFGLGSHQARVRLIVKNNPTSPENPVESPIEDTTSQVETLEEEPLVKPIRIPPAKSDRSHVVL